MSLHLGVHVWWSLLQKPIGLTWASIDSLSYQKTIVRPFRRLFLDYWLTRGIARRLEWQEYLVDGFPWDAPLESETDFVYPNEDPGVNIFSI